MCGCGRNRRCKRHVRGGGTRQECNDGGGDEAYDIAHNASWIGTVGSVTHRCEAKATQLQNVGVAGCNVGGTTKSYEERRPQMRGASTDK
jgi:hypothetical protein